MVTLGRFRVYLLFLNLRNTSFQLLTLETHELEGFDLQEYRVCHLNAMIRAVPSQFGALANPTGYVDHLPHEVLGEIFEWIRCIPCPRILEQQHKPFRMTPMLLSHVCSRWRRIVLGMTSQWTRLEMNSTTHPDVFAELLSRSKRLPFSLFITLPTLDIERCPDAKKVDFRETFTILKRNVPRLRSLQIRTNNATFFLIFNKFLRNVHFPRLELLSLEQVDPAVRRYNVGPVEFNPAIFRHLRLENIMIDCDATCLGGLRRVHLVNSAGTLLDQTQLMHSTYPVIPEAPAMPQLVELKVECTHLVPVRSHNTPSFRRGELRSLILSRISMPMVTDDALQRIDNLFHITYSPSLEILVLDRLDQPSFQRFVLRQQSIYPKFQSVNSLSLIDVDLSIVDHHFMRAFPRVTQLNLIAVNPQPMLALLQNPAYMPTLTLINIDHQSHPRVICVPTAAVAPSAGGTAPG
ncbi:hypothetical protein LshimejAT787_0311680 [Lyophyllum shimeji]|uniref:F-box domain-containing protein n=1 Tax=Lyophyllum shimeji TaxID=47721 RepID=A0A9P3UN14_LYOSH|nr:hypothetical protein LshimejAT787_0311680 [Lyophyllum shimeji]